MLCAFCHEEMINKELECFCNGKGCVLCSYTGKAKAVQCVNPNCEPPDHHSEPWDDEE